MVKKILIYLIIILINCSNQRDRCYANLKTKEWPEGGSSYDICSGYVGYELARKNMDGSNLGAISGFIADNYLILCLKRIEEEKQCEKKSNLITHIGY
jgi:hypothetical protein